MQALEIIQSDIIKAAQEAKRDLADIHLIAVSKNKSVADILPVIAAGQRDFGENYVQEAIEKITHLKAHALIWHYIGRIQTNKLAEIVKYFDYIHSIGSLRHAQALAQACQAQNKIMPIFLQVNFDREASKEGFMPEVLIQELKAIHDLAYIKILGLMLLPSPKPLEAQEKTFLAFRAYRDQLSQITGIQLPELSMGMSADFAAAIYAGATYVRIGTKLFGQR